MSKSESVRKESENKQGLGLETQYSAFLLSR